MNTCAPEGFAVKSKCVFESHFKMEMNVKETEGACNQELAMQRDKQH